MLCGTCRPAPPTVSSLLENQGSRAETPPNCTRPRGEEMSLSPAVGPRATSAISTLEERGTPRVRSLQHPQQRLVGLFPREKLGAVGWTHTSHQPGPWASPSPPASVPGRKLGDLARGTCAWFRRREGERRGPPPSTQPIPPLSPRGCCGPTAPVGERSPQPRGGWAALSGVTEKLAFLEGFGLQTLRKPPADEFLCRELSAP